MSQVAKEIHVKAFVHTLPTFVMGVFKLNAGFWANYEKMVRDFWWGEKVDHRKVHWMSWENITKPKRDGGIRFRDM